MRTSNDFFTTFRLPSFIMTRGRIATVQLSCALLFHTNLSPVFYLSACTIVYTALTVDIVLV